MLPKQTFHFAERGERHGILPAVRVLDLDSPKSLVGMVSVIQKLLNNLNIHVRLISEILRSLFCCLLGTTVELAQ